ncbi:MAG TPA: ATP-binding protein [Bacteroidia bacterium]|nr:ATP-binding protein [Bacteroidia bacterium]
MIAGILLPLIIMGQPVKQPATGDSISILLNISEPDTAQIELLISQTNRLVKFSTNDSEVLKRVLEVQDKVLASGYKPGIIAIKNTLSTVYLNLYNTSAALRSSMAAFNVAQKLNDNKGLARASMQNGLAYYLQKSYEKSITEYTNASGYALQAGDSEMLATLKYLIAIDLTQLNRYSEAIETFNELLNLDATKADTLRTNQIKVYMAEVFLKLKQPEKAMTYANQTLDYLSATDNKTGIAKSEIIIADAYKMLGNIAEAKRVVSHAALLADSINEQSVASDAYYSLYQLAKESGDFSDALLYSEKYHNLKDTLFNTENSRIIAGLELQQLISQKQNEILQLENQKRNQELLLKGSVLIGLLFLLLFILLYSRYLIRQKANRELATAYEHLRNTQEQLISHEKMASLGHLTAGIAHEIKNPLNFVNNFSAMALDIIADLNLVENESERKELMNDLLVNLQKINKHGQRADSIVKSMLEHSRTGNAEKTFYNLNTLIEEFLTLSYQGVRAFYPSFTCELQFIPDKNLPEILIAGQEISRVLINIFNNAFYALHKKQVVEPDFKPCVTVKTGHTDEMAVITIHDNGTGIPAKIKEKIFEPFFTTKPAGEGTGLGLSISYEIITAHGGKMEIASEEGQFTEFTINLPLQ